MTVLVARDLFSLLSFNPLSGVLVNIPGLICLGTIEGEKTEININIALICYVAGKSEEHKPWHFR